LKRVILAVGEAINADDITLLDLFIQAFKQAAVQERNLCEEFEGFIRILEIAFVPIKFDIK